MRFSKTLSSRLRTIIHVILTLTTYAFMHIDTKSVKSFHAHLLNKRNRPLSGDYEICLALSVVPLAEAKLRKLSIALTNWEGRAKLGRKD